MTTPPPTDTDDATFTGGHDVGSPPTYRCDIDGTAVVQWHDDGTWSWQRADPDVHISDELLNDATPEALAFLTAMYEIGTWCDGYRAWHGHHIEQPTQEEA